MPNIMSASASGKWEDVFRSYVIIVGILGAAVLLLILLSDIVLHTMLRISNIKSDSALTQEELQLMVGSTRKQYILPHELELGEDPCGCLVWE